VRCLALAVGFQPEALPPLADRIEIDRLTCSWCGKAAAGGWLRISAGMSCSGSPFEGSSATVRTEAQCADIRAIVRAMKFVRLLAATEAMQAAIAGLRTDHRSLTQSRLKSVLIR
jgi:hypothetical protein